MGHSTIVCMQPYTARLNPLTCPSYKLRVSSKFFSALQSYCSCLSVVLLSYDSVVSRPDFFLWSSRLRVDFILYKSNTTVKLKKFGRVVCMLVLLDTYLISKPFHRCHACVYLRFLARRPSPMMIVTACSRFTAHFFSVTIVWLEWLLWE